MCRKLRVTTLFLLLALANLARADLPDKWDIAAGVNVLAADSQRMGLIVESRASIEAAALRANGEDLRVRSGRRFVDLSEAFPRPGNQGSQSSCVGWALAYAHAYHMNRLGRREGMSSPAWIYNQIQEGGCSQGSQLKDGAALLNELGAVAIGDHPYDPSTCAGVPSGLNASAMRQRTGGFGVLDTRNLVAHTRAHIDAGIPVVIGYLVTDGFMSNGGSTYRYSAKERALGGHAMVVVGFDEARQRMRVLNSWGRSWGDRGYAWIDYSTFEGLTLYAYAIYGRDQEPIGGGVSVDQFDGIKVRRNDNVGKIVCTPSDVLAGRPNCQ